MKQLVVFVIAMFLFGCVDLNADFSKPVSVTNVEYLFDDTCDVTFRTLDGTYFQETMIRVCCDEIYGGKIYNIKFEEYKD